MRRDGVHYWRRLASKAADVEDDSAYFGLRPGVSRKSHACARNAPAMKSAWRSPRLVFSRVATGLTQLQRGFVGNYGHNIEAPLIKEDSDVDERL